MLLVTLFASLSINQHGTQALQQMIEFIYTPGQVQTIINALRCYPKILFPEHRSCEAEKEMLSRVLRNGYTLARESRSIKSHLPTFSGAQLVLRTRDGSNKAFHRQSMARQSTVVCRWIRLRSGVSSPESIPRTMAVKRSVGDPLVYPLLLLLD